ncbi:hypothetical protein Z948_2233 [Sulfitobacter donghicola DSW-25 = KCTC 12864 = JCM 14565]|nr:hypothetical protein Z948_2233 [Sulfitobacter donghicola DSW-25 = KCTC 12864 = JCM 14565]
MRNIRRSWPRIPIGNSTHPLIATSELTLTPLPQKHCLIYKTSES